MCAYSPFLGHFNFSWIKQGLKLHGTVWPETRSGIIIRSEVDVNASILVPLVPRQKLELFNLTADPSESQDLLHTEHAGKLDPSRRQFLIDSATSLLVEFQYWNKSLWDSIQNEVQCFGKPTPALTTPD